MGTVEGKHSGGHYVRWFEQRSRLRHGTGGAVEVLPAIECLVVLFAKISAQTLLPHAWRGLFGGHGPKDQRIGGKKGVGPVNHTV